MASRGESSDLEAPMVPDQARARFCKLCSDRMWYDLGLGVGVFVAFAFIGASFFRRDFGLLASAAWSFILVFPLLQVLFPCCRLLGEGAEKEVNYQLSGNVVKKKSREKLKDTGTDLVEKVLVVADAAESTVIQTGEQTMETFESKKTADQWCKLHMDAKWYRAGGFSLGFTILKAILNIYSVISTAIRYNWLTRDRDEPGWLGITWVVSIEIPYMLFFLLPYFVCTAMQLRGWCTSLDPEGKIKAVVRLSGLLKSLARFSALNLLELIRIDDFIKQDKMRKVTSIICSVIGFMAFRGKVQEIAFVVIHHISTWTLGQWIKVFALINNMLGITDLRNNMIVASIQTKEYRKDRWLEAVGAHLMSDELRDLLHDKVGESLSFPCFFAFQRLVSMGPDDVDRLLEDLGIDYKNQSGATQKPTIPKQILDDCWNWQLTNVVGVVRFGLFYARALANNETASHQEHEEQERLQQGKVKKTEEEQHKAQRHALEETAKKEQEEREMKRIRESLEVKKGEHEELIQNYQKEMEALDARYEAERRRLKAVLNEAKMKNNQKKKKKNDPQVSNAAPSSSFTWDALDKVEYMNQSTHTDYVDSPPFELSGYPGFNLRYWPGWDVLNNRVCLRLIGPQESAHVRCKIGVGYDADKEVALNEVAYGRPASSAWYFAAPTTNSLREVWAEVIE